MRKIVKRLAGPVLKKISNIYFSKPRQYRYNEIEVTVPPGVFPPHLTISTKLLLEFIDPIDLHGKTFLELGCGSAIISVLAAKKGAVVTSTDINPDAVSAAEFNSAKNGVVVEAMISDLFEKLDHRKFDFIVINPPYYPEAPQNMAESAWYCGENFEYFERMFSGLPNHTDAGEVLMILSEDCDIGRITAIAIKNNFVLEMIQQKNVVGESNFIYRIKAYTLKKD